MSEEKIKVLMVDDDVAFGDVVVTCLRMEGFNVEYVTTLLAMESMVKAFHPNVIVLDVEVGEGNGVAEMGHIREYAPNTPVIFVSSHVDSETLVSAIEAGGTIYLRKPLDMTELMAYLRKIANVDKKTNNIIKIGDISIDTANRTLTHADGTAERLTAMQQDVLLILIENANKPTTRTQLCDKLWPEGNYSDASLDNIISKLRKLLTPEVNMKIETLPKVGFELMV